MKHMRMFPLLIVLAFIFGCEKPIADDDTQKKDNTETTDEKDNTGDSDSSKDNTEEKDSTSTNDNGGKEQTDTTKNDNYNPHIKRGDTVSVTTFLNENIQYAVYVKGYIVGACKLKIANAEFGPVFTYDTSILLADKKGEKSVSNVISIQLKKGGMRDMFNLVDNPKNYNRRAYFYGMQNTYLGIPGMKNDISDYDFCE